jgi:hypothetical protein
MARTKRDNKCNREVPTTKMKKVKFSSNVGFSNPGKIFIINHHTARIVLPRVSEGNVSLPPLNLEPGAPNLVDEEEWRIKKKNKVVSYYIDKGILVEVKKVNPKQGIGVFPHTADLKIPEHLESEEEMEGKGGIGRASVVKKTPGTVVI